MANAVCNGVTNLAYKLYDVISKKDGNILFSPFSIHTILSMIYQGSSGTLAESLETVLGIKGVKKSAASYEAMMEVVTFLYSVKLYVATKVYAQDALKEEFTAAIAKSFLAEAETIDLKDPSAVGTINSWVEEKTESRIKDLASQPDIAGSSMVLVNTVNLKGDWMMQLEDKDTKKKKFYTSETESVDCDMMKACLRVKYGEDVDLEAQVLALTYENEAISLMIFLPRVRTGIKDVEARLQHKTIPKILQNMDMADVMIFLPKFSYETKTDLQGPLTELGLGALFENADLPNVVEKSPVKGVKLIQKTSIGVAEQGTDANDPGFVFSKGDPQNQRIQYREFNADHPFLFMLMYQEEIDRAILLAGRVMNPVS